MEARQDSYIRFISEITRRIHIKGGDPTTILTARKNLWKGISQTDMYLALHTNIPEMEMIPSTWDQQTAIENTGTLTLCTTNNNITKLSSENAQPNTCLPRQGRLCRKSKINYTHKCLILYRSHQEKLCPHQTTLQICWNSQRRHTVQGL